VKKVLILVCSLLFVSVAGFGQTQSPAPLTQEALAAILGLPAASSCGVATQPGGLREVAKRPAVPHGKSLCTATATCQFGLQVSCSSNVNAANCSATNAACPGQAGSVTCDGVTTNCQPCCTGTGITFQCCECDATGDCVACCRCGGGTLAHCSIECSG
jgi:hypothetical protein